MPLTQSAKKTRRRSEQNRSKNRHFLELYRETRKEFERGLSSVSERSEQDRMLSKMYRILDTLAKKHILHQKNADRKKAQFARRLKSVSVSS